MTYRSSAGSPRASGRGGAKSSHEKAKIKGRKHHHAKKNDLEETNVKSPAEVADKTLSQIGTLGKQKFATSPFREHFTYWLVNIKSILSEFESEPSINIDEQFTKEVSAVLSKVENELEQKRREEISLEGVIENYSSNRIKLKKIETDYSDKTRELTTRKNTEITRLSRLAESIQGELLQIARIQAGIFRPISKKTKTAKQEEATQRLNVVQKELDSTLKTFEAEQGKLDSEYAKLKETITQQMDDQQKLMENQEVDLSAEPRTNACDSLMKTVKALMQRKNPIAT